MIILSLGVATLFILVLNVVFEKLRGGGSICLGFIFSAITFPQTEITYLHKVEVTEFVSSGSSVGTQGYFSFFGGSVGSVPVYKLRKKVGKHKYRDFIVQDVTLEEVGSLVDTGKYIQEAECPSAETITYMGFSAEYSVNFAEVDHYTCKNRTGLLQVPIGSIVKHIQL